MGSFQDLCLMLRPSTMLLLESKLDEPLLLTWHGPPDIQMRRNLWQDGLQVEDQIGSFFYSP
ncbi:unnamed protein product [Brassica oleracea var. botrytis]